MYVLDLGKTYDLSNYKGVALSGKATEQMSIELYPDTADFQQDKYWTKQVQFATYPFFEGSHAIRSYEGTSYGEAGVEENWWCNWIDGVDSKNVKVDGTTPKGNLTNVRYVVLKANKFDANKPEHVYELKSWYSVKIGKKIQILLIKKSKQTRKNIRNTNNHVVKAASCESGRHALQIKTKTILKNRR